MNILLHVCCGPCLLKPGEILLEEGHHLELFFHNPNIHPLGEYRKRRRAAEVVAERLKLALPPDTGYGLESFLCETVLACGKIPAPEERCRRCYTIRMKATAQEARQRGCPAFSTTLLVSQRQKHDLLKYCAEEAAREVGVQFYYRDFRPEFEKAQDLAKRLTLYRQQYCGCIFSEQERFSVSPELAKE